MLHEQTRLITGGSHGLCAALVNHSTQAGWQVIELPSATEVVAYVADVICHAENGRSNDIETTD